MSEKTISRCFLPAVVLATLLSATPVLAFPDESKPIEVSGMVVDPQGKPIAATVTVVPVIGKILTETRSNSRGEFRLKFRPADIGRPLGRSWHQATLVAKAKGFAPAWMPLGQLLRDSTPTLKLANDSVPIRAQFVDMDGRPIVGAELTVFHVYRMDRGNLDAYLKELRDEPTRAGRFQNSRMIFASPASIGMSVATAHRTESPTKFRTDKDGRIEIKGVGPERKLYAELTAPGVVSENLTILTRPKIAAKWKRTKISRITRIELESGRKLPVVYAAKFTHIASPSQPVSGTIRDHKTGAPIAGISVSVQVKGQQGGGYATTDKNGRYVVDGVPTAGKVSLYAINPKELNYINAERARMDFSAAAPLRDTDFKLVKGIPIRGRLIDSSTGKPVQGRVTYLALTGNVFAATLPDPVGPYGDSMTDADGRYKVVALPGPGLLVVNTYNDRYMPASLEGLDVSTTKRGFISSINMGFIRPGHYDIVKSVNVAADVKSLTVELRLRTGIELQGQLVDTNGKPIHGVVARGLNLRNSRQKLVTDQFTVSGVRPGQDRMVFFQHEARRLATVLKIDGKTAKLGTVALRLCGTLTGRIVDADGSPLARARFALMGSGTDAVIRAQSSGRMRLVEFAKGMTDADGRFHLANVIAGYPCEFFGAPPLQGEDRIAPRLLKTVTLRSGEVRDLGDLPLRSTTGKK